MELLKRTIIFLLVFTLCRQCTYADGLFEGLLPESPETAEQGNAPAAETAAPPASDETFSVISNITGETISAVDGHAKGFYAVSRASSIGKVGIPNPETAFPGGYVLSRTEEDDDGMYYLFKPCSDEYTPKKYWELLSQSGFECTSDAPNYYYASLNGLPQIIINDRTSAISGDTGMWIFVPEEYTFALPNGKEIRPFDVTASFTENDYGNPYDTFVTCPVYNDSEKVNVVFALKPGMYPEGTRFALDDFLSQNRVVCNYSCRLLCSYLSDKGYLTYDDVLTEKDGYKRFKALDAEILQNSDNKVVIRFYIKAINSSGTVFEIESISSFASTGSGGANTDAFDENGKCKNCNGWGWVRCISCGGDGEERCRLCGGDGRKYNVMLKRDDLCSRCGGSGKSDCTWCKNGRCDCRVCGGVGHK